MGRSIRTELLMRPRARQGPKMSSLSRRNMRGWGRGSHVAVQRPRLMPCEEKSSPVTCDDANRCWEEGRRGRNVGSVTEWASTQLTVNLRYNPAHTTLCCFKQLALGKSLQDASHTSGLQYNLPVHSTTTFLALM